MAKKPAAGGRGGGDVLHNSRWGLYNIKEAQTMQVNSFNKLYGLEGLNLPNCYIVTVSYETIIAH